MQQFYFCALLFLGLYLQFGHWFHQANGARVQAEVGQEGKEVVWVPTPQAGWTKC